jgi:hypothetical protein
VHWGIYLRATVFLILWNRTSLISSLSLLIHLCNVFEHTNLFAGKVPG